MGDRHRQVAEEGPVAVVANEFECTLEEDVVRVLPPAPVLVLAQVHPAVVERQPERVEEVCMHLMQVSKKVIKALSQRMSRTAREAEPPLPVAPSGVTRRLQDFRQRDVGVL